MKKINPQLMRNFRWSRDDFNIEYNNDKITMAELYNKDVLFRQDLTKPVRLCFVDYRGNFSSYEAVVKK